MVITVVNGNQRHGSTWNCKELFLRELSRYGATEVKEFTLPGDLPHFCAGCFSCFLKGEQACPHAQSVSPIVAAFEEADLIILTSPVYAMDVSGPMKSLLDHLCFMWMSHRPNPKMFRKTGLIITTTAGAGSSRAGKTMKNSMRFWGVNRIFLFGSSVSAMKWDDVDPAKKEKLVQKIRKQSAKVNAVVMSANRVLPHPARSVLFLAMKSMMKKNDWNPYDREHWERNGWI